MFSHFSLPGGFWDGTARLWVHGAGGTEGGGWVGIIDSLLQSATRILEPGSGGAGGGFLAGIAVLGANVHPMVVHFPIAFLTTFFLFEVLGVALGKAALRRLASGLLYLGAASAVAAIVAGLIAEDYVVHSAAVHEIMEWHERLGFAVAGLSVTLAVWRAVAGADFSRMAQGLHFVVAGIVMACMLFGADLGGLMVYEYGVGVKGLQQADDHHHHHGGADSAAAPSSPEAAAAAPADVASQAPDSRPSPSDTDAPGAADEPSRDQGHRRHRHIHGTAEGGAGH
jgi:uncharacterized membrane protein